MPGRALVTDSKWFSKQHDRCRKKRDHAYDVKAVHKCKQVCLRLQMGIDVSIRSVRRLRRRHAVNREVMRHILHLLLQLERCPMKIRADGRLMIFQAAFGSVFRNAMPKLPPQLRKKLVRMEALLFWLGLELGIGDDGERDEEEGVAESLKGAAQRVVGVVGLRD